MTITKALVIASPFVERILEGIKTWEMRSTATQQRGRIALVRKGSGLIVGTAELSDSIGPLTPTQMLDKIELHQIHPDRLLSGAVDKWRFAWVLEKVCSLVHPVPYRHLLGAVIWVSLSAETQRQLNAA